MNQLLVADITYSRLRTEFVYLAVLLDAFSRRVMKWASSRSLEAGLAASVHHGVATTTDRARATPYSVTSLAKS